MTDKLYTAAFSATNSDGFNVAYGFLATGGNKAIIHEFAVHIDTDTPGFYLKLQYGMCLTDGVQAGGTTSTIEELNPDTPASLSTFYNNVGVGGGVITVTPYKRIFMAPHQRWQFRPVPDDRIVVGANSFFGFVKLGTGNAFDQINGFMTWEEI